MEFKSVDMLTITECCEHLNLSKQDLPKALLERTDFFDADKLIVARLQSLIDADEKAYFSCSTIEHYEEYLISNPDGLYRDQANSEICKIRKNEETKCVVIILIVFITNIALIWFFSNL